MTLNDKSPAQLETMIAAAREKEKSAKAALFRDGQPMFLEEEHERQAKAIETQRRQTITAVTSEAQRRVSEIEVELLPSDVDPLTTLTADDLAKASALSAFVKEDIAAGQAAFLPKLRGVVLAGDKPTRVVWYRCLSSLDTAARRGWSGEVQELHQRLEAIVRPPDRRQGELRTRQEALASILTTEAATAYLARTYGARRS
jgi:hypothetical protein